MKYNNKTKTNTKPFNDDSPYRLLADAVILQAVKDYRQALKHDNRAIKRECCRFFRSEWFKSLTTVNGEQLISKFKSEVQ